MSTKAELVTSIDEEFNGEADSFDTNTSPTTTTTTTSTTTVLKVKITDQDKEALHASFEKLDSSKFWMLQATKMEAERQGSRAESVKEKAMSFTLLYNYYVPVSYKCV
ncbi:hypothetical protein BDB00DRAFT_789829 [Zychaea mexicana]|uniref:uncharacterized protein n=1 Tax=Zychaea mexicana TaxID=64656 RepID=UPI0022FEED30|nr:uncharacterized protein BDB00DRAFT_789829 [Zychaea mexicana]KAI9491029.1 hypothetical protein BDB00DRAFT_789829 [Zychaea mexicana]